MVPIKLTLKNFMSYSEHEVMDFTRFHVAAIVGKNGNGKSSLWDAITWCIWGRARGLDGAGRGSDDLIRIGADEMEVEFIFEINNTKYRILRKKKRNSNSILEFNIINDDGTLKSLTQEKLEDTKNKIEKTIMLDYDTFVASSFMPQNKYGFFSEADPTKRKEIFSEVLGLDVYDKLQEKAKLKRNEYEKKVNIIDEQLKLYMNEIKDKNELINQKEELSKKCNEIKSEIDKLNNEMNILQEKKRNMEDTIIKYNEYIERIKMDEKVISEYKFMLSDLENKINEINKLIKNEDSIFEGYNTFKSLQDQLKELDNKYMQFNVLEKDKMKIKNDINLLKKETELELKNLQFKYNESLEKYKDIEKNTKEVETLEKELEKLNNLQDKIMNNEDEIQKCTQKIAELKASFKGYNDRISELKENYNTILKTDAKCPLCNSPLDQERKSSLLDDFKEKINGYKKEISILKDEILKEQNNLEVLRKERENLSNLQHKRERLVANINTLKNNLSDKENLLNQLNELKRKIEDISDCLNNNKYAVKEIEKLSTIENKLKELNFSVEFYEDIKVKYEKYRDYEKKYERLNISKQNIVDYQNTYSNYKKTIDMYTENLKKDKEALEYFKSQCSGYDVLINDIKSLKQKIDILNNEFLNLNANLASISDRIRRIEYLETKINDLNKEKDNYLTEIHYYEILERSFGKKGIQALIIENALPEFEDTANNFLSKLSDGKMYVSLLTQKTNKNGSVQETLDIEISDELGKRKYELFSGGEAFRINFALRIALSKFLSKRAGVNLQTLIIDEGFGSQDVIGRQNIIDVLNMIKDEFELIIVITHIDELKDSFPYSIEITKDENGSHIVYS
ncbi:AAA family ATPase [Thermoanaerobacterium butyriciformans]|uniref:Nuclease SbcCD subunit C n=1 Tax=Thermoanaerobacterium butyriciformans TaxID=1702242 RepID=A0ABS4NDC2_9THEO|nr:SMC family ATPase [Thermoanaerobacterium butyriciformans]MBP2071664.1 exonuclease SbcC [Thermoanaerobacterium butyriciformans]